MVATLLFEPRFIQKMIEIGEKDGAARADEIAVFLGLGSLQPVSPAGSNSVRLAA
jgi:hypothetical protein